MNRSETPTVNPFELFALWLKDRPSLHESNSSPEFALARARVEMEELTEAFERHKNGEITTDEMLLEAGDVIAFLNLFIVNHGAQTQEVLRLTAAKNQIQAPAHLYQNGKDPLVAAAEGKSWMKDRGMFSEIYKQTEGEHEPQTR